MKQLAQIFALVLVACPAFAREAKALAAAPIVAAPIVAAPETEHFAAGRITGAEGLPLRIWQEDSPLALARALYLESPPSPSPAAVSLQEDGTFFLGLRRSLQPKRLVAEVGELRFEILVAGGGPGAFWAEELRIPKFDRLQGLLVDPEEKPIPGAKVFIEGWGLGELGSWRLGPLIGRSDTGGNFELPCLPGSRLVVVAEGYEPAVFELEGASRGRSIFELHPAPVRRLYVFDQPGVPLPGVVVGLVGEIPLGITDGQGEVAVSVPDGTRLELLSERMAGGGPLLQSHRWYLDPPRWSAGEARTFFGGAAWLTGVLLGEKERPLGDAVVEVAGQNGGRWAWASARMEKDGRFLAGPLPTGSSYRTLSKEELEGEIRFRAEGYADRIVPLRIEPGDTLVDLGSFTLERGEVLEGRVVDPAGRGIADADLFLRRGERRIRESYLEAPRARTRADGSFSLVGLRSGEKVALQASAAGYLSRLAPDVRLDRPDPEIVLQPASVLKIRTLDEGGMPVSEVELQMDEIAPVPPVEDWDLELRSFRASSSAGEARFELRPRSRYRLNARRPGFLPVRELTLNAEEESALELRLSRGAVLAGRVSGPSGEAISRARLSVESGGEEVPGSYATDEEGSFEIAGLESGLVRVSARRDGYGKAEIRAELKEGERKLVALHLPPAIKLHGALRDAAGKPVAGWLVELLIRRGEPGLEGQILTTRSDGGFACELAEFGRYAFLVRPPGTRSPFGSPADHPILEQEVLVDQETFWLQLVLP